MLIVDLEKMAMGVCPSCYLRDLLSELAPGISLPHAMCRNCILELINCEISKGRGAVVHLEGGSRRFKIAMPGDRHDNIFIFTEPSKPKGLAESALVAGVVEPIDHERWNRKRVC